MRWTIRPLLDSIRAWNSTTNGIEIPLGLSRSDAERLAQALMADLIRKDATRVLSFTDDLPDILYALCDLIARDGEMHECHDVLASLYDLVVQVRWPHDDFGERSVVLARIAQLAWSSGLGRNAASESARWERASIGHFLARHDVGELLALPPDSWTTTICDRFLTDRATLLGLCMWMQEIPNFIPHLTYEMGSVVHTWLESKDRAEAEWPENAYLLVDLALLAAGTSRIGGRYGEARKWISLAEKWCESSKDVSVSSAKVEYGRLALSHDARHYEKTLARVARLVERFVHLGLLENIAKTRLLQAATLKELGRDSEALEILLSLEKDPTVVSQSWLQGMVMVTRSEIESRAGNSEVAFQCIHEAGDLLRETEVSFARAHWCGVAGEIFRDHGRLPAAAECYRRGVEIYLSVGMAALAAYMSLLLAETLVGLGKEEEAIEVIVASLPTIARENLVHEGIAAIALLKASASRRRLDSEALRTLRESIERSRSEAEP